DLMLQIMRGQLYRTRIPRYVTGYRIPHKTGDFLPYVGDDVGMLEAQGRTIILSVFTGNHFGSGEALENAIGLVSKAVADYFAFGQLCYVSRMAGYLDQVPFSGIIRIRDMMYSIADPYRLDQGDVSFDSPDSVKSAMIRAIHENKTHYLQTTGVPRLRE